MCAVLSIIPDTIHCLLALLGFCRAVLPQPDAQRYVFIRWRVEAIGVNSPAEQLPSYRVALRPKGLHRHVVFGTYPPVAISIEQHFAGYLGPVRTGRVPFYEGLGIRDLGLGIRGIDEHVYTDW